ncbi:MAG TPA: M48 family metalloprotease [Acidobacteriota bacterium]|nr:M48 family metalloprotease [Acidobacteriota bacterium]
MAGWRILCFCFALQIGEGMHGEPTPQSSALLKRNSSDSVAERAFRRLQQIIEGGHQMSLRAVRPPKVSPEFKARVMASLPPKGEIRLKGYLADKLKNVDQVLRYHDRVGIVEIKVIGAFQAAVAIHARCVVLVSEPALRLLTADELLAIIAHEVGHEYVWEEYQSARRRNDYPKIQELELWCDGVAILTLLHLELDPENLIRGLSKLNRFNERFGTPLDANHYPGDRTRADFQRRVIKMRHFQ